MSPTGAVQEQGEMNPVSEAAKAWREKRRRQRQHQAAKEEDNDGASSTLSSEPYVPYQSAAKRMRSEREAVLMESIHVDANNTDTAINVENPADSRLAMASSRRRLAALHNRSAKPDSSDDHETEVKDDEEASEDVEGVKEEDVVESLLEQAADLKEKRLALSETERKALTQKEEEARILKEASKVQTNALQAASELAQGTVYRDSLRTSWTIPKRILAQGEAVWNKTRDKWHILAEGHDIPPPMKNFPDMKFPSPILDSLREKNIQRPTPIQMQGLPVALSGRDMVGIAFTGSGKTMTFSLPLVMAALEEEMRMPILGGEGPVGFILAPSRELARQTFDVVHSFCAKLGESGKYPQLRAQLLIGGENSREQLEPIRERGVHCIVATPGRIRDFLKKKQITLDICRYACLDEADRMLDLGFDEEVGEIMNFFTHQRQTLLFSATFPKKFQDFAKGTLVQPIVVNVGRAGAANLDVIQEVEYVKQEAKIVYLLECLQKTAPPVVIFCERKGDVDDIHEYLLLKGVEAVSIHGGKDQAERNEAIAMYKDGKKDVLVATDIAAKGLDFADIQHVINFDMPSEIENYVHRIGRTGRCGKTGVATTFINKSCEETTLLDLKHLLKEAHQRIPPVLMIMDDPLEHMAANEDGSRGCSFCGGLGHSIVDCPKIDKDARRVAGGHKDAIASGDGYGGDW
eukprot:scaffold140579_cov55-Attheya_sp.AAC.2